MPAYYRTDGLTRVAPAWRGKPILTAEQIEDVVAFLATLRDELEDEHASSHRADESLRDRRAVAAGVTAPASRRSRSTAGAARRPRGCRPRSARWSATRRSATGKVKLDLPPLVENGNTVPLTVASRAR